MIHLHLESRSSKPGVFRLTPEAVWAAPRQAGAPWSGIVRHGQELTVTG